MDSVTDPRHGPPATSTGLLADVVSLEAAVLTAVGAASMAWTDVESAGVFREDMATHVAAELITWIGARMVTRPRDAVEATDAADAAEAAFARARRGQPVTVDPDHRCPLPPLEPGVAGYTCGCRTAWVPRAGEWVRA